MEDARVAMGGGHENRDDWLRRFYFGAAAGEGGAESAYAVGLKNLVDVNLEAIDARSINSIRVFDDSEGRPVHVRVGRYGPYLERMVAGEDGTEESQRANLPESMSPDELTLEVAEKLFSTPQGGRRGRPRVMPACQPARGHEPGRADARVGREALLGPAGRPPARRGPRDRTRDRRQGRALRSLRHREAPRGHRRREGRLGQEG